MKNEIIQINEEDIKNKIYIIRGKEVMLDSDLAKLYHVETKRINEAVKNNPKKFPERYSWKLTDEESKDFLVEIFDQKKETRGGKYKNPRVFTEQGVSMLSTILKSNKAIETSIKIIDAFVAMRHTLLNSIDYQKELFNIQNKILEHDQKFIEQDLRIEGLIDRFSTEDIFKDKMIFKGELYDGFSLISSILDKSKKEIIVIDNYCDKEILNLICNLKVNIIVISGNMNDSLIERYQKQYNNLTIIQDDSFHDRFIIIDKEKGYHLGSSIKDIGKRISYIDTIEDQWLKVLFKEIEKNFDMKLLTI